jgi:ribulose-phosphate 3-epimerase
MTKILLSASILSADFTCLREQIQEAEQAGIDFIHIDVMDGFFVPNITMGPFIVEACRRVTQLPLDVHLMIDRPEKHSAVFASAGASHISIHPENNPNIHRTLHEIERLGCQPGVAINPGTSANVIETLIYSIKYVLILTVNPGYSGQQFIPEICEKIGQVSQLLKEKMIKAQIKVDGGITPSTLPLAYQRGARIFIAATAIFKHPQGIRAGIQSLHNSIK